MRIVKLELENYRGFEHLELDFHPELTVLVGVNGSGKTTVLDAIAQMLRWGLLGTSGASISERRAGESYHAINLDIEHGSRLASGVFEWRDAIYSMSLEQIEDLKKIMNFERGPIPTLVYLHVWRSASDRTPNSQNQQVWNPERIWGESLYTGLGFDVFFQWFREREDLENADRLDDPDHRDRGLETVRRALESLLPGFTKPRVRRPRFVSGEVFSSPVLMMSKDGQELAFSQLSEGERMMAAMVGDIARRLAIANPEGDPLDGDGVVMIDEIDLHLHPHWQANVIPALRRTFPKLQFIITTHSPIVLSYVESECVRLLQDFQVFPAPARTAGRDPNSLYLEIFDQPVRPQATEDLIARIAELIDQEQLEEARAELAELGRQLGDQDNEVIRLQSFIAFLEA
jgi:predicted ATPase